MSGTGFPNLPARIAFPPPARIRVTGTDAARYLNGQLTINPSSLPESTRVPALLLTAKGRLIAPVLAGKEADAFLIESLSDLREDVIARLERYLVADDVTLEDVSEEAGFWHVVGREDAPPGAVKCARMGIPGFDCTEPPSDIPEWSAEEAELFRIGRGVPVWGRELVPDTLPHEAGLDRTHIDFHKGCYVGQETISRVQSVGRTHRTLAGLMGDFPPQPASLVIDGSPAGTITSAARHLGLSKTLALAYVPRRRSSDSVEVVDASGQTTGSATIHEFPLF